MSRIGRALRRLFGSDGEGPSSSADADAAEEPPERVREADGAARAEPPPRAREEAGPLEVLEALADVDSPSAEGRALVAFSELVTAGQEARAIVLGRALLGRSAGGDRLRGAVAEVQVSRADDAGALDTLASLLEAPNAPLALLAMAARAHERLGEEGRALLLWQRVLARDVDYPGARQRVSRRSAAPVSAGATLASGGELSSGRYLVRRELGRGGAGAVFEALDRQLGRPVALKVYHDRGAAARARLRLEARTPAAMEHPGVIRVFDLDEELGAIAMEWVRGASLKRALSEGGPKPSDVRRWLLSLVDALAFVHDAGYVHRDLKPSNVLLRRDGRAVLTDFGLALPVGEAPKRAQEGTRGFAAPEQLRAAPAHRSADVYALGALLLDVLPVVPQEARALRPLAEAAQAREPAVRPGLKQVADAIESAFDG